MEGIFKPEGKVYQSLYRLYQLMVLNFLFLIFSLPIITIGANISALYACQFKILKGKDQSNLLKLYIMEFRKSFKEATIIWLGVIAIGVLSIFLYPFLASVMHAFPLASLAFILLTTIILLALLYLFPLVAYFDNKIRKTVINAFLISFQNIPWSILLLVINGLLLVIIPLRFHWAFFLWLTIGFSLTAMISAKIFKMIFEKYIEKYIEK